MTTQIKAIIIDQDLTSRSLIRQTLSQYGDADILAETDSFIYGYELIRQNRPNLVFVDIRDNPAKAFELVNRISTYFKEIFIVLSGPEINLELIRASMQSGAREYLKRPIEGEDLRQFLQKHADSFRLETSGDSSGRILTVFSNKGGLGKTTIAVNLALALSEVVQKPVALVDLNLQLGDITTFLDVEPKQTIVDIAKNISRVDEAYLRSSLAEYRYGNSQLYILADPLHVEEGEEISAEQINTALTVLKGSFEYVVVDTTTSFDSKTLTALDLADHILLVSMINLPSIRSTQRVLTLFDRLAYDKQKVKILMNRYVPDNEITLEDVEDTFGHPVFWKIANNYQVVMTAINRGLPIPAIENSQALYDSFLGFAREISGTLLPKRPSQPISEDKEDAKGILGSLFGLKRSTQ